MRRTLISHPLVSTLLAIATTGALASSSTMAAAQTTDHPRFAVNKFDPAEKGSEWFVNESLDMRGKLRPALGLTTEISSKPVIFYFPDGSQQGALVTTQLYAHLGASVTLLDRIRIGANLPLALYQDGDSQTVVTSTGQTPLNAPSKAAVGDLRVGADLRLIGEYKDAFTLAVGGQVHLPTGVRHQYTGDGATRIVPRLMIAGDLAGLAYAVRIGYEFRQRADDFANVQFGDEVTGGVAIGLRAFDRKLLIGPEFYGSTLAAHAFHERTSPSEIIFGGHYTEGDWRFGAGLGAGLTNAFGSPDLRAILGIEWSPAIEEMKIADRDKDGIDDANDACPDDAGPKTDDPATNGCPVKVVAAPVDSDGDGIPDSTDACPDQPGEKTDDPKTNGCPPPPPDKDKDGIADADDACPDVAGVKNEDPKLNGCPLPPPDKDKDGIADADDACPDVAGVKSTDPTKNGCPALAVIEAGQIKITEQVKFKTGSAEILKESDAVLGAVLGILKEHPEIKKVHIEGYTDNKGAVAMNKTLSTKRAASVAAWLQLKGIDKTRLDSKGFGQDKPIDTNATDAGRQNNRRVEFHIEN